MTSEHAALEARVARLERDNRRLRGAGFALALLAGAFALFDARAKDAEPARPEIPAVVATRSLRVVDPQGKPRAVLATSSDGVPFLTLSDRNGQVRATLFISDDGRPALTLNDGDGRSRATLGLERSADGFITFFGKDDKQVWSAP